MPSERALQALRDICENAKLAQSFVAGLDYLGSLLTVGQYTP
jgi:hypothetical protein